MATVYEMGPFRLEADAGVLLRMGIAEPLGKRAVKVLAALVKAARKPVTKDAIIDAAWPGLVVEEANLSVQISSIRRVLSHAPGGDRWIETLAGRGYRYVGPVTELRTGVPYDSIRPHLGNLPQPLASFIGRERELVDLKRLLAKNRLLTLVGAGGIGKTRLATQLAVEVCDAYRDGVWFVDLAPLADPSLVPSAMAQVLEVQQTPGKSLTEALCRHLRSQRTLLVIDNCEHLAQASAQLIEAILHAAVESTVIATSREPLRAEGEQLYWVAPLSLPDVAAWSAIARSDAVALFVDRAQHQDPAFALTDAIARGVADLCARLDGIPLALELAAPLVQAFSIDEINGRLDDRFAALAQGRSTALPRQQTLRATLDWSYDLLSEAEREVLRRAAVFRGGFTCEAAAAVACDAIANEYSLADVLGRLRARSLLLEEHTEAGARFRLLETTRAYALEKLNGANELATVQERHARYFATSFEHAADDWMRQPEAHWRAHYCPELDNLRAALDWSTASTKDGTLAVALAGPSGPMWTAFALYAEGAERLRSAALAGADARKRDLAQLWLWLGVLIDTDPSQALEAFETALRLHAAVRNAQGSMHARMRLAYALTRAGRLGEAEVALAAVVPRLKASTPPKLRGFYFSYRGYIALARNDPGTAKHHYERALQLYREAGYDFGVLGCAGNLAEVSWQCGDLDAAATAYRDVVAMRRSSQGTRKASLGWNLANLVGVLTEQGKLDEALAAAREAMPLLRNADRVFIFMDHFALRTALTGALGKAAMLGGYADRVHAAKKLVREPNEARAYGRLHALLRERIDLAKLEQLIAKGASMTDEEACRLAVED